MELVLFLVLMVFVIGTPMKGECGGCWQFVGALVGWILEPIVPLEVEACYSRCSELVMRVGFLPWFRELVQE